MTREPSAALPTRIERIRESLAVEYRDVPTGMAQLDVQFLLEQYDASVKILAEAEKILPGIITTAGSFAV